MTYVVQEVVRVVVVRICAPIVLRVVVVRAAFMEVARSVLSVCKAMMAKVVERAAHMHVWGRQLSSLV